MKNKFLFLLGMTLVLSRVGFAGSNDSADWHSKMRSLGNTLGELLKDLSDSESLKKSSTKERVEKNTRQLAKLAHAVDSKKMATPELDPSIEFMATLFSEQAEMAANEFKRGNVQYARGVIRSLSGYCIACHSRSSGPEGSLGVQPSLFEKLPPLDRAEALASSRYFDEALSLYQSLIGNGDFSKKQPFDWERATRQSLAIAVRIKKDPTLTRSLIKAALSVPNAPRFFRADAEEWLKTITTWEKERARKINTAQGSKQEMVRVFSEAVKAQKYPADRAADILYLRASAAAHDFLRLGPNAKDTAEAFLVAGKSYEALQDLRLWNLHEIYYEACIQKLPHSATATNCYLRLEESYFAGYTGSGGTDLPDEIREKLKRLEALASLPAKNGSSNQ